MEWNLDDSRSIWPQLREQIMRAIVAGEYKPGDAFPTVRDLAQDAGVNRNTMQRAMAELEGDGLLITNRTSGRKVTDDQKLILKIKEELAQKNIENFIDEMQSLGYTAEEAVKMAERVTEKKGVNDK